MFKFLKNKLKNAVDSFSKGVEEEAEDSVVTEDDIFEVEETPKVDLVEETKKEPDSEGTEVLKKEDLVIPEKEVFISEEDDKKSTVTLEVEKKEELKESMYAPDETVESSIEKSKQQVYSETDEERLQNENLDIDDKSTGENIELLDKVIEQLDEGITKSTCEFEETAEKLDEKEKNSEGVPEIIDVEIKKKKGFFGRFFSKKDELPKKSNKDNLTKSEPESVQEESQENVELLNIEDTENSESEKISSKETSRKSDISEENKIVQPKIKTEKSDLLEEEPEKLIGEEENSKKDEPFFEEDKTASEKKGMFGKLKEGLVAKKLSDSKFEKLFFELEITLLENNVAVEVIDKLKNDLKINLVDRKLNRFEIEKVIMNTLKKSLYEILDFEPFDIVAEIKKKKPFVIVFAGVNGSGKTTTIGKIAKYLENNGLKSVLVAADTFRAAAIQQLEEHANRLNMKIIKHDYGSDPAAVAYDGIKYAESKGIDVVLIDTAGRLHSNANLMAEMEKIIRVSSPDMKIFIGESITGNDCVEQAQKFNETIGIDGIVLSKADVDEKGGAAISVSYVTKKPILFLGNGQEYKDIQPFDKNLILKNLGL